MYNNQQSKNHRKAYITVICIVIGIAAMICGILEAIVYHANDVAPLTEKQLTDAGIGQTDKLMIVAHPDDETLWGGGHLMEGGYFIVCVTNGRNQVRHKEFEAVLKKSGNHGIILDYPDKVLNRKSDWKHVKKKIAADVRTVMTYRSWDLIVTHNRKGEYGHIHHIMTHRIVTDVYRKTNTETPLYCFGRHYKKDEAALLPADAICLTDKQLQFKEQLEKMYHSQRNSMKRRSYMNPFEKWTLYQPSEEE